MNKISLSALNRADTAAFTSALAGVFEHSHWIPAKAAAGRPYSDIASLHAALCAQVEQADQASRLALMRAHPELAGKAATRGELSAESAREQQGAKLDACDREEFERLRILNAAYRAKFGVPFIVAVRNLTRPGILALMERRLRNDSRIEMQESLQQIYRIAWFRLQDMVEENRQDESR